MYTCKFAKMYDNTIFTRYHLQPVAEDYFEVQDTMFCVADGVTRDTIEGNAVPYPQTKEQVIEWIQKYPNPSGAAMAAQMVANNFVDYLKQYPKESINKEKILEIIKKVNQDLRSINENRNIDYLKEDLYCCEAVGGIIVNDMLYCFSIGDCHIMVLDKQYNTIFETINNHTQFEEYLENIYQKDNKFDWHNPKDRIMVRKEYRNNPSKTYQGKDISFGALSGEKEAEYYIDVYQVDLKDANYICAYSDGCEPIFADKETIKEMINNPEKLQEEGKERTLIIYEKN